MAESNLRAAQYVRCRQRLCVLALAVAGGCQDDDAVIDDRLPPVGLDGGSTDAGSIDAGKPDAALDAGSDSGIDAASGSGVGDAASDSGVGDAAQLPKGYCLSALSPPTNSNLSLKRGGCACESTSANSHGYCVYPFSFSCHDNRWKLAGGDPISACTPFPRDGSRDLASECAGVGGTLSASDCPQGFQSLNGSISVHDAGTDVLSVCCFPIQDIADNCVQAGFEVQPAIASSGNPLATVCSNGASPLAYLTGNAAGSICCAPH